MSELRQENFSSTETREYGSAKMFQNSTLDVRDGTMLDMKYYLAQTLWFCVALKYHCERNISVDREEHSSDHT